MAFSRTLVTLLTKILVLRNELIYFVKHETKSNKCHTENEVISMLEFLIDSISVELGGYIFNKSLASLWEQSGLLSSIFSHTQFRLKLCKNLSKKKITEHKAFNITFRYIEDDQPINNPHVADMYLDFDTIFNFLAVFMTTETSVLLL